MGKMMLNGKEYAGSGSKWHEYSTSEKVVGKWIDGKPIYEKTKVIPISDTTVNNKIRTIPLLETNQVLFKIVDARAVSRTYGTISYGLDSYVSASYMDRHIGFCHWYGNNLAMFTTDASYWSDLGDITVIYQYTKTTD